MRIDLIWINIDNDTNIVFYYIKNDIYIIKYSKWNISSTIGIKR